MSTSDAPQRYNRTELNAARKKLTKLFLTIRRWHPPPGERAERGGQQPRGWYSMIDQQGRRHYRQSGRGAPGPGRAGRGGRGRGGDHDRQNIPLLVQRKVAAIVETLQQYPILASEKFPASLSYPLASCFLPLAFCVLNKLDPHVLDQVYALNPDAVLDQSQIHATTGLGLLPSLLQCIDYGYYMYGGTREEHTTLLWVLAHAQDHPALSDGRLFRRLLGLRHHVSMDVIKAFLKRVSYKKEKPCSQILCSLFRGGYSNEVLEHALDLHTQFLDCIQLADNYQRVLNLNPGHVRVLEKVLPKLRHLTLYQHGTTNGWGSLIQSLQNCSNLQSLTLSQTPRGLLTDFEMLQTFLEQRSPSTKLKFIVVGLDSDENNLRLETLAQRLDAIQRPYPLFDHLCLRQFQDIPLGIVELMSKFVETLEVDSSMQSLEAHSLEAPDQDLGAAGRLWRILEESPHLQQILLIRARYQLDTGRSRRQRRIVGLEMGLGAAQGADTDVTKLIARIVQQLPTLTDLRLCTLGEELHRHCFEAEKVCQAVAANDALKSLRLEGLGVHHDNPREVPTLFLKAIQEKNTTLRELHVWDAKKTYALAKADRVYMDYRVSLRTAHFLALNTHGRGQLRNNTTLAEFACLLKDVIEAKSLREPCQLTSTDLFFRAIELAEPVQDAIAVSAQSVLYGLLRETPDLWCNSSQVVANPQTRKRKATCLASR